MMQVESVNCTIKTTSSQVKCLISNYLKLKGPEYCLRFRLQPDLLLSHFRTYLSKESIILPWRDRIVLKHLVMYADYYGELRDRFMILCKISGLTSDQVARCFGYPTFTALRNSNHLSRCLREFLQVYNLVKSVS